MSYCVNCGVELDKSAEKCALCGCPVVNPMEDSHREENAKKPFSDKIVIPRGVRKRYAAYITTFVMIIPNIVCALTNMFLPETGLWSLYVILTSLLIWTAFVLPFILKKPHPYVLVFVDIIYVLAYLYGIFAISKQSGWFLKLALPLVLLLGAIILFMYKWLSKKRDGIVITIAVLVEFSVYSLAADILFHLFYNTRPIVFVSVIITASCAVLIMLLVAAIKNKRFRAWLSRKFFI